MGDEKPVIKRFPHFMLVPVPTEEQPSRQVHQPGWWTLFIHWLRYHSMQTRWDIERWLARKLHRRW